MVELSLGFKEKGHTIAFLTYHFNPFFKDVLDKAAIQIACIQEPNYFSRLLKMRKFIRKGKFDAVLSFLEAPNFICEMAGLPFRKWKLIVGERNANPGISKSLKLRIYRWLHIFADHIVANSHVNLKLVRSVNQLLQDNKCTVIYNIVDFERWKPNLEESKRRSGKLQLVIAASQCYRKNLNGLLIALSLLDKQELSKITIDWYGDSITEPYIDDSIIEAKKKIVEYGLTDVIRFYPATHDITAIIQKSDAVGLFSFYEGLPNIICESMSCGKPVICSSVSDLPVMLSHNSNLLCNPADQQSIKRALSYLISLKQDQLEQIGLKNFIIAKERFRKEGIVTRYLELMNK